MTEPSNEMTENTNDLAKRRRIHQVTEEMADHGKAIARGYLELADIGVDTRDIAKLVTDHFPPRVAELMLMQDQWAFAADSMYCAITMNTIPTNDAERIERTKKLAAVMGKYEATTSEAMPGIYHQLQDQLDRRARNPSLGKTPMERLIDRLFADAPKLTDAAGKPIEGQAPALECSVVLRTLPMQISGSLSRTAEGTLRMLSPTEMTDPQTRRPKMILAEQFFEIEDVVAIVMQREVTASPGERRIITS